MANNLADAACDFVTVSLDLTAQLLKILETYVQNHRINKQLLNDFKNISRNGQETPVLMSWSRKNGTYVEQLLKKVREYNENVSPYEQVSFMKLNNQAGVNIVMTNSAGQKIMEKLQIEMLAEKNIKPPECSDRHFLQKHTGEEGLLIRNLEPEVFELLKEKPWSRNSKEELKSRFSVEFMSIPKTNDAKDIIVSSSESLRTYNPGSSDKSARRDGVVDHLLYANAVLAGSEGKIYRQKLQYEKDIMKKLSGLYLSRSENKDSVLYVTSKTAQGKYLEYKNNSFTIHQVGYAFGKETTDFSVEIKKGANETDKQFFTKAMREFSVLSDPVILGCAEQCVEHNLSKKNLMECLSVDGEKMIYPDSLPASKLLVLKNTKELNKLAKIFENAHSETPSPAEHLKNCSELLNQIVQGEQCPNLPKEDDFLKKAFKKSWNRIKVSVSSPAIAMALSQVISKSSSQIDPEVFEISDKFIKILQNEERTIGQKELEQYYCQIEEEMKNLDFDDIYNKSVKNALLDNAQTRSDTDNMEDLDDFEMERER